MILKKWNNNANLLILQFEEISPWPELSIPPRVRIQGGGYPERYGSLKSEQSPDKQSPKKVQTKSEQTKILVSNMGC